MSIDHRSESQFKLNCEIVRKKHFRLSTGFEPVAPGGGALPSNGLMGMCRWMGSHFQDWIDYNRVAFSTELLEWGRIFSGFGGKNIVASREFGY